MGRSVKAELSYGYRLCGGDEEWLVLEVHPEHSDEYGLNVDWLDDEDNFDEVAESRMLALVGFTETDWQVDGYYDRKRAAKSKLGVRLERTGWEAGDLLLVTAQFDAYAGGFDVIDPAVLAEEMNEETDGKLRSALAAIGLTPLQERPQWLLTAYCG